MSWGSVAPPPPPLSFVSRGICVAAPACYVVCPAPLNLHNKGIVLGSMTVWLFNTFHLYSSPHLCTSIVCGPSRQDILLQRCDKGNDVEQATVHQSLLHPPLPRTTLPKFLLTAPHPPRNPSSAFYSRTWSFWTQVCCYLIQSTVRPVGADWAPSRSTRSV